MAIPKYICKRARCLNKGPNGRCVIRLFCNNESQCPDYKSFAPTGYLYLDYAKIVRQGPEVLFLEVNIKDSEGWRYSGRVKMKRKAFK